MSQVEAILTDLRAAAFQFGIAALCKRSNVSDDSIRRLLRTPPLAINNLKALEKAAAELRSEAETETGTAAP